MGSAAAAAAAAAARALFILLLSLTVIQAEGGRSRTCSQTEICAVRGSAVNFSCPLTNPERNQEPFWVAVTQRGSVDLRRVQQDPERLHYRCSGDTCSLQIQDLRPDDSAEYQVQVKAEQSPASTGSPGVLLEVADLQVTSGRYSNYNSYYQLKCVTSGCQPGPSSYIWYKNGDEIPESTSSSHVAKFNYEDSYSCAVRGHEDFPSPSVCLHDQYCNLVTYSHRSICAPRGSTLSFSASYRSYDEQRGYTASTSWFRTERGLQGRRRSSDTRNLQSDGRVQISSSSGTSTLSIRNLTESDSAEYQFRFRAYYSSWTSVLPGTGVTVTALQVQLLRDQLRCVSSCSPAERPSFLWFLGHGPGQQTQTSVYEGHVPPGTHISCALKGYEDRRSPAVYGPKSCSVSASPSAEVEQNSSVTLSCSSDANPAANYSWFKDNQSLRGGQHLQIISVQPEDRGFYSCNAANEFGSVNSPARFLDVQYPPKSCSVSASPSAEVEQNSSVTLSCSCDANPAANYSWFKDGEKTPKSSEQNFTITNVRAEDAGTYSCHVWNTRGRLTSSLRLAVSGRLT